MTIARINGIDLYYEDHGDARKEPVLLIMGFTGNAGAWAAQIPALAERYRVIAFDNRGAGRSSRPDGPYSMQGMAADAAALLDHLAIASAHIVGASMGGMIAQEFALQYPERVRSLVLACTTPGGPHSFGYEKMVAEAPALLESEDLSAVVTPEQIQAQMLLVFTPEFIAHPHEGLAQMIGSALQFPASLAGVKGQMRAILAHDTYDRLPRISARTLVISGDADELVDARNSPLLAERIPGATLVLLAGQRHGFTAEKPAETNAAILDFLGKHAAVPAA